MLQKIQSLEDMQQHYRWLQQMREAQPVWLDEDTGDFHVFRYRDVSRVLAEYQFFSSERMVLRRDDSSAVQRTLIDLDPPEHRRYRNLVSPFFTPQALARLSGLITALAQELLDQVRPTGHMDVISDLAYPLPATVIAQLLGIPTADLPLFKRWSDELSIIIRSEDLPQAVSGEQGEHKRTSVLYEMSEYFRRVLQERRREPREDLISALVAAELEGEHLSEEEVISFCIVLLRAGHVTTTRLLSGAIWCFNEHPLTLDQLRMHPELMPGAIEEVLRYTPPAGKLPRTAKTSVTFDSITIPEGARIFAWLSSANRDEAQFPDPERFDIMRSPNRHIAFGHGIHFCVGAPLARLEASIALPMMLEQLPELHVSREEPLELSGSFSPFDFQRLPVTFASSGLS